MDGLQFVTARGWEDLSNLMDVYEDLHFTVDEEVIHEFVRHEDVAEDVSAYFDLYKKYEDDYGIADILEGKVKASVYARIFEAAFDERICVVNLLLSGLTNLFYSISKERKMTDQWYAFLKEYRKNLNERENISTVFGQMLKEKIAFDEQNERNHFVSKEDGNVIRLLNEKLKETERYLTQIDTINIEETQLFTEAKKHFDRQCESLETLENRGVEALEYAFSFMEQAFSNWQEMVVFVTGLTITPEIAVFVSEHPNASYEKYKNELLIGTKRAELLTQIREDLLKNEK